MEELLNVILGTFSSELEINENLPCAMPATKLTDSEDVHPEAARSWPSDPDQNECYSSTQIITGHIFANYFTIIGKKKSLLAFIQLASKRQKELWYNLLEKNRNSCSIEKIQYFSKDWTKLQIMIFWRSYTYIGLFWHKNATLPPCCV